MRDNSDDVNEVSGNVWKRVELCESDRNCVEMCGNVWKRMELCQSDRNCVKMYENV